MIVLRSLYLKIFMSGQERRGLGAQEPPHYRTSYKKPDPSGYYREQRIKTSSTPTRSHNVVQNLV